MFSGIYRGSKIGWLLGSSVCVGSAGLLIVIGRSTHASVLAPIVFLAIIMLCARFFGVIAGIIGSIASTALFALFLYEPYGRLQVSDRHALSNLVLLLFVGIALSYANSERDEHPIRHSTIKHR